MYARIVMAEIDPGRLNEAVQRWHESVAPSAQQQPGFRGARLLIDRGTGKVLSMTQWEAAPDISRSIDWNQGQLAKFAALVLIPPRVEEGYEVVAEVTAPTGD
jgi:heme-degrading monooxygenase HmoA